MSENQFRRTLHEFVWNLDTFSVPWALIGGLAVAVRSEPIGVRSMVQVALPDRASAFSVQEELKRRGYMIRARPGHCAAGRPARSRLLAPVEGYPVLVDLVFGDSCIEPEVITGSTQLEVIPGLAMPVAATGHLLALTVLAGGFVLMADFRPLFMYADDEDLRVARYALQLISERGQHSSEDYLTNFENRLLALCVQ